MSADMNRERGAKAGLAESPDLCLYLLGASRIERHGMSIRLPTRKALSLLAYLVLHPIEHSREKLAALFWGDSPDQEAKHSLRVALAMLRSHLGKDLLLAGRETVQINPGYPIWVDVLEFEARATQVLATNPPDPARSTSTSTRAICSLTCMMIGSSASASAIGNSISVCCCTWRSTGARKGNIAA